MNQITTARINNTIEDRVTDLTLTRKDINGDGIKEYSLLLTYQGGSYEEIEMPKDYTK